LEPHHLLAKGNGKPFAKSRLMAYKPANRGFFQFIISPTEDWTFVGPRFRLLKMAQSQAISCLAFSYLQGFLEENLNLASRTGIEPVSAP
jgi:hypothetical protein